MLGAFVLMMVALCAGVGWMQMRSKGRDPWIGLLIGAVFNLVGLVIIALMPAREV